MDTRNRSICNCFVCRAPIIFNSRRVQKKHRCRICRNLVCQRCIHRQSLSNGKQDIMCNFCLKPEIENQSSEIQGARSPTSKLRLDNMDLTKMIDKLSNCPICQDFLKIPIILCSKGHSMCESCVSGNVDQCPLCRSIITKTRNFALERFMSDLNLIPSNNSNNTCKYLARGCAKYFDKESDKIFHERECILRDFSCPLKDCLGDCKFIGKIEEFVDHFERYHDEKVWRNTNEGMVNIDLKANIDNFTIIDFMNGRHYFLLRHRSDLKIEKAYWAIQLIGSTAVAQEYTYEFEISNGRRKMKRTEICKGDASDCNEIFENDECFSIPFKNLTTYLDKNGLLKIKFQISRTSQEDKTQNQPDGENQRN